MALTVNLIEGFDAGGLYIADVINGSPSVDAVNQYTGAGCFLAGATGDGIEILTTIAQNVNQFEYNIGLRVRFENVTTDQIFWASEDNTGSRNIALQLDSTGYFQVIDANGAVVVTGVVPISVDTWYHLEMYWFQNDSAGEVFLVVDGVVDINHGSTEDFKGLGGNYRHILQAGANFDIWIDDYYHITDSGGPVNFIGVEHEVLGVYQNTAEDSTDQGDPLTAGTWANAGEVPKNDSNTADYDTGSAGTGYARMDEGTRLGPLTDIDGAVYAAWWMWNVRRGSGSGTTHYLRYGAYDGATDQVTDSVESLNSGLKVFARSSITASRVPDDTDEYFCQGIRKTSGGREIYCAEMWACILHQGPSPFTQVNKDLALQWDIIGLVNKDQQLTWDILNLVNKDQQFQWDILNLVNKDQQFQWDIAELVNKDLTLVWDMGEFVYKDLALIWDIFTFNPVYKDLLLRWSIRRVEREGPHFLGFKVIIP